MKKSIKTQLISVAIAIGFLAASQEAAAKFSWECTCVEGKSSSIEAIAVSGTNLNCKREVSSEGLNEIQVKSENAKIFISSDQLTQSNGDSASFDVAGQNDYNIEKFEDFISGAISTDYYSHKTVSAALDEQKNSYKNTSFKLSLTKCEKDAYDKYTGSSNCSSNGKKYEGAVVFEADSTNKNNNAVAACVSNER